ncbi:hypothetical protein ILYODFUR_038620 [Ilyodon furcidens]|uniref:Uncharacterized protein n=1 Tax=Ilyodon furcidens TaxID=33524 RepID=A0ABV0VA79_9TELE
MENIAHHSERIMSKVKHCGSIILWRCFSSARTGNLLQGSPGIKPVVVGQTVEWIFIIQQNNATKNAASVAMACALMAQTNIRISSSSRHWLVSSYKAGRDITYRLEMSMQWKMFPQVFTMEN